MSRNVALLVLDTVRKDYFDEYAPRLRELSDVSFEQCRAVSSWSVPSHASLFTGRLPSEHGFHAERFDADTSFAELAGETMFDSLPHRTVGVSANGYVNRSFRADALFDEFHDYSIGSHVHESLFPEGLTVQRYMAEAEGNAIQRYLGFLRACAAHDHPARSLANGVWSQVGHSLERLPVPLPVDDGATAISRAVREATATDEPSVLFANYMDAHTPLRTVRGFDDALHSVPHSWNSKRLDKWELNADGLADETYTRNYRELYGAAIDYLDRRVSVLVEDLLARDPETTVVVTADHGHNLGFAADDGGLFQHTASMSEGVMHVPCEVINPPAGYPDTVTEFVSQLRLRALVERLARGEPFDETLLDERVVAETVGLLGTDDGTWGREFSEAERARWTRMIRCAYGPERKVEWDSLGACRAYRLDADRPCWQAPDAEETDPPEWATERFPTGIEAYKRRATDADQNLAFDDGVETRLRELGYL